MKVKSESEVTQLCPTPGDPMDCSPPGSSIHGSFQARVLEWGARAFSEGISKQTETSRILETLQHNWLNSSSSMAGEDNGAIPTFDERWIHNHRLCDSGLDPNSNQPWTIFWRKLGEFAYGLGFIEYQNKFSLKNFKGENGILVMWGIIHIFLKRCRMAYMYEFEKTPGDSGGQRSLACCSPWSCKELDMT